MVELLVAPQQGSGDESERDARSLSPWATASGSIMFREMICFVISGQAIKPEQHINIEVCGSGLFYCVMVEWMHDALDVGAPQQGSGDESELKHEAWVPDSWRII